MSCRQVALKPVGCHFETQAESKVRNVTDETLHRLATYVLLNAGVVQQAIEEANQVQSLFEARDRLAKARVPLSEIIRAARTASGMSEQDANPVGVGMSRGRQ